MSTEKVPNGIPIDDFDPDIDDLDEYAERFEGTVDAVTNTTGKDDLYKKWFRTKMKRSAWLLYKTLDLTKDWKEIKLAFKKLLVSPEQKSQWRAGHRRVVWDGRESFHALGSRVKSEVDTYIDKPRPDEYYQNFRNALPKDYQSAIDLGVNAETLDEAKRIAFKFQTATATQNGTGASAAVGRSVAFNAQSMEHERLKSVEMALQGVTLQCENNASEMQKLIKLMQEKERGRSPTPGRQGSDRSPSQGVDGSGRGSDRNRDNRYDRGRSPRRYDDRRYDDRHYDDRRYDDRRQDDRRYDNRRQDDRRYDDNRYDDRRQDDRRYDDRRQDDRRYDDRRDARDDRGNNDRGYDNRRDSNRDQRSDDRSRDNNRGRRGNSPGQGNSGGSRRNSPGRYSPGNGGRGNNQGRQSNQGDNGGTRDNSNGQANRDGNGACAADFESPLDWLCAAFVNGLDKDQLADSVRKLSNQQGGSKN